MKESGHISQHVILKSQAWWAEVLLVTFDQIKLSQSNNIVIKR